MNAPYGRPTPLDLPHDFAAGTAYEEALLATVDEGDDPMLLVGFAGVVLHANEMARTELSGAHPLQCVGQHLRACSADDSAALDNALIAALAHGVHTIVAIGRAEARVSVGVIAFTLADASHRRVALVLMDKRRLLHPLSVPWHAPRH